MNVLFLGENVGRCGTGALKYGLKTLKQDLAIDFTVINGEGTSMGYGIMSDHVKLLIKAGVDAVCLGEKSFFKIDLVDNIAKMDKVLRPANYPETVPGTGLRYFNVNDKKICIINMLGMMSFQFPHLNNPYLYAEDLVKKAKEVTPYVFFIFHAQATAEKTSMGYLLNGKASCVIGTHGKVLTSDAGILSEGTAYITDTGRCGSSLSVGGFDSEREIYKYSTAVPVHSKECLQKPQIQGVCVSFDETGKAQFIKTVIKDVLLEN